MQRLDIKIDDSLLFRLGKLANGYNGKALSEYLELLLEALQDLSTMDKESFEGRKQAKEIIQANLVDFFIELSKDYSGEQSGADFE